MKFLVLIFILIAGSAYAEIPLSSEFSGLVRGDYRAPFCRISKVNFKLTATANDQYEMTWIETGKRVDNSMLECVVDYSGFLTVSKRGADQNPIEWSVQFSLTQNFGFRVMTLNQGVYRLKAETENFEEGRRYKIFLGLSYHAETKMLSYNRVINDSQNETISGDLTALVN